MYFKSLFNAVRLYFVDFGYIFLYKESFNFRTDSTGSESESIRILKFFTEIENILIIYEILDGGRVCISLGAKVGTLG